jgi:hypothetical protein
MKRKLLLTLFVFILGHELYSQTITAYVNFRNYFVVFDNGSTSILETLPPKSFKAGPNYLAYIDNVGNLKVYYEGKVETLDPGVILNYEAGDDYLIFEKYQQIKVWHNGNLKNLGNNITAWDGSDSIVAFYDSNYKYFHIYYHDTEYDLGDGLVEMPFEDFSAGNNVFAFMDKYQFTFTVFYNGEFIDLCTFIDKVDYKLDADIVAYTDDQTNTFKAFFRGDIYDLENLPPSEYKVGHGMVAYVNQNEEFKVFYNGDIYNVLNYAPSYFDVKDSLIAFNNEGFLNVFFDGVSKQITRYIPPALEWDWSTLAYVDDNLKIQAFMAGKQEFIINETIRDIYTNRDIITIRYGNQSWAIYYGGKLYYMQDQ